MHTYILGAGFSRAAGFPLLADFYPKFDDAKDRIIRRYNRDRYCIFDSIMQRVKDKPFEAVFDDLQEQGALDKIFVLEEAVAATIVAFNEKYQEAGNKKPYNDFLTLVRNQRASLITLNYDTILEQTLESSFPSNLHQLPVLRFDYKVPNWSLQSSFIEVPGKYGPIVPYLDIPLLKLHGSTNFFQCPIHNWSYSSDLTNNTHPGRCLIKEGGATCGAKVREAIVAPRKFKNIKPFKVVWDNAERILNDSEIVTLIGVNLNEADTDFNGLLANAIKSSKPDLGYITLADNPEDIRLRVRRAIGHEIPLENISTKGFEEWISQMSH